MVIIGGGDTAADCLGVAHRQGAAGVHQLDLYPQPPDARDEDRDPWPTWPWILRNYPAHEEGGERDFAVAVQEFVDDGTGAVRAVRIAEVTVEKRDGVRHVHVVPGTERELPADLVLLAIGFDGTEEQPLLDQLGVARNRRGVDRGAARLADRRRRRVRRRRHAPGRVADRVGDRRGPGGGRGDPLLPGRRGRPAGAGDPGRAADRRATAG